MDTITPVVHKEELVRSEEFIEKYQIWQERPPLPRALDLIRNSYYKKTAGIMGSPDVFLHNSQGANGFFVTWNSEFENADFDFLLEFFKDRVLGTENYQYYFSDKTVKEKSHHVETSLRHYLKPIRKTPLTEVQPQHFGNLLLEYVLVNDAPSYLKVMAFTYSDSMFSLPLPHSELIQLLFPGKLGRG